MTHTIAKRPTPCIGCGLSIRRGERMIVSTEGKHCSIQCALDTKASDRACLTRTDKILALMAYRHEGVREAIALTQ